MTLDRIREELEENPRARSAKLRVFERIINLCNEHSFFQISGEDINSPRQSFTCPAMADYPALFYSTYALIGHEKTATADVLNGMFTDKTIKLMPNLNERISFFSEIGRKEEL